MTEHAGLGRDVETHPDVVQQARHADVLAEIVGRRVDADDRVAGGEQKAVEDAGRDAVAVVRRVIRLQARRQPTRQSQGIAKAGDNATLGGHRNQVLQAHDLGDCGRHLGRDPGCQRGKRDAVGDRREQPFAKRAHGQAGHGREGGGVVGLEDQARHLVLLSRHHGVQEEVCEGHVGERDLRRCPLHCRLRREARQDVTRAQRRGLGEQLAQRRKDVSRAVDCGRVAHRGTFALVAGYSP